MRNPYRARVDERHFLNLPGFHGGAYVRAYVEDTSGRGLVREEYSAALVNREPRLILEIADCNHRIALEFELYSAVRRMNSFHKIDTLIAALEAFRDGMSAEAEVYRAREQEVRAAREAEQEARRVARALADARRHRGGGLSRRQQREIRIAVAEEAQRARAARQAQADGDAA